MQRSLAEPATPSPQPPHRSPVAFDGVLAEQNGLYSKYTPLLQILAR
jgi:hypothetical protein